VHVVLAIYEGCEQRVRSLHVQKTQATVVHAGANRCDDQDAAQHFQLDGEGN
jgi:hypothetical protein